MYMYTCTLTCYRAVTLVLAIEPCPFNVSVCYIPYLIGLPLISDKMAASPPT